MPRAKYASLFLEPKEAGPGSSCQTQLAKELSVLLQESYCHDLLSAQQAPQRHTESSEPLVLSAGAG